MEFLAESMLNITLSMSMIILLMLIFSRIAAKKLTARCRYLLWCLVILRLAIPAVGLRALPPLFTVTLPETVIVEEDIAETLPELNEPPYSVMPQQPFESSAQDIIAARLQRIYRTSPIIHRISRPIPHRGCRGR